MIPRHKKVTFETKNLKKKMQQNLIVLKYGS